MSPQSTLVRVELFCLDKKHTCAVFYFAAGVLITTLLDALIVQTVALIKPTFV